MTPPLSPSPGIGYACSGEGAGVSGAAEGVGAGVSAGRAVGSGGSLMPPQAQSPAQRTNTRTVETIFFMFIILSPL